MLKKIIKNILKYFIIYIAIVIVLFLLLVLACKIPREAIYKQLKESAEYYRELPGISRKSLAKEYEALHYAADSKLLNIIYHIDSNHPIKSAMEAKYYDNCPYDSNEDFVDSIDNNIEANKEYLRYWHGSISIITPLLLICNISQIYLIINIIFWILLITLIIVLIKKYKTLAVSFIIASIMIHINVAPRCLEYIWTILIMLIVSIISLIIEKKGNQKLYLLYFITGIITCYIDFLSTETLTITIPILIVTLIRYKEKRIKGLKEGIKFVIISSVMWFTAYGMMWITKWILASIILKINAIEYVRENALLRLNMSPNENIIKHDYQSTVIVNLMKLYPFHKIKVSGKLFILIAILITTIYLILKTASKIINQIKSKEEKEEKEIWIKILLLGIGIIPYVRYLVLLNHAYCHNFFTYRAQMPTIIAIIFIIIYSVDKRIRTIKLKDKKKLN